MKEHGKEKMSGAYASLRSKTRDLVRGVWKTRRDGGRLASEDEYLAEILEQHPEYDGVWGSEQEDDTWSRTGGVNPYLHVTIHQIVENQIRDRNPPQVQDTLARLLRTYHDRHEVIHKIGTVVMKMLFDMGKGGARFDLARYTRDLEALT